MAVNVPTTWINSGMSEFDSRLFAAINDMLLDMLAAVARRDYIKGVNLIKPDMMQLSG